MTATYTYDPLGNRNSQTVGGVTTQLLIDPAGVGRVASTYTGSGSLIAHYIYGFGLVSQVSAAGSAAYYDFNLTGSTVGITGHDGRLRQQVQLPAVRADDGHPRRRWPIRSRSSGGSG